MNEFFALSLGLGVMFFTLGHGCLHHFISQERSGEALPLMTVFVPRPGRGLFVASVAFLLALLFLLLAFKVFGGQSTPRAAFFFVLFACPLMAHVAWLFSRCRKTGGAWAYVPASPSSRASQLVVRWVFAIPVIATAIVVLARAVGL